MKCKTLFLCMLLSGAVNTSWAAPSPEPHALKPKACEAIPTFVKETLLPPKVGCITPRY